MTQKRQSVATPRIFYGWILVCVLLLILSIGVGTSMYMYSVIAAAVEQEFAAGRLILMSGSTGLMLMLGLCSPVVGALLDRHSSRSVLVAGALIMGLGFILMGLSTRIWMVVASYVVFIAIGAATLSYLTAATLISRWFVRHRGLAIGVASLGTQLGGFVYPPIFAAAIELFDWRIAICGLGGLIIVVIPSLSWLAVVDRPEDLDQHPDGDSVGWSHENAPRVGDVPGQPEKSATFGRLLRQRNFLLLTFIVGTGTATNSVLMANLALFAMDLGEPAVRGAFLISLVALLGIVFSPLVGWLCDVINIKVMTAVLLVSFATACLLFGTAVTYSTLAVAACFMGVAGGGLYPLWASMVGKLYPSEMYGRVMGLTTFLIAMFTAAILLFAGWVHDATDSYRWLFLTLLAMLVVMTALVRLIRLPRPKEDTAA